MSKEKINRMERHELLIGVAMASPWIIGFMLFMLIPLLISLIMSFTNYSFLSSPQFVGLNNYRTMLFDDPLIWKSLKITFMYAVIAVPTQLILGFILAVLLNMKLKGILFFRTVFYIPTLIVVVSASLLWQQMLNTDFGVVNYVLSFLGISKVQWLASTGTIIASLVIINLWGVGKTMIINLAGLQSIPTQLYEASEIEGCGKFRQTISITLPMLTPTLFFNLMTGLIGAFKAFTMVRVLTNGGPNDASLFYMLYLYKNAFVNYRMGYASAMSWLLFAIVTVITLLVFKTSKSWVYYEGGEKN